MVRANNQVHWLFALRDCFFVAPAPAPDFALAVLLVVFLRLLGALSASPGPSGL
jgi:hypothetical protein